MALLLAACQPEAEKPAPEIRPVRAVTVEKREAGVPVVLTGRIQAQDEVPLAFRLSGRMVERTVNLGDRVQPDQVVARLEPQNEMNALRAAEANLAAAEGQLVEARADFRRQQTLSERGFAAQAVFDRARQAQQTAQSAVDAATAMLKNAKDQVSFTELRADAEGVVTAVGAEQGEVVQAGQRIIQLARQGGRDAVFDVPAQVIRSAPADPRITVFLTDDPAVKAAGRVREVAPQADPVTRTFEIKVGLADPPPEMRLGATVTGRMEVDSGQIIEIPATALTQLDRRPAVWIVDPATSTVSMRNIDVLRFDPATVVVSEGVEPGEIVVTAGVQALHPGQKVRLLEAPS
jgi:RND family efflux transporter MFP subunit